MTTETMPPAFTHYTDHVAREVGLNAKHSWCDPNECARAAGLINRCKHGTNIGTWDGPDYLCGPCESGDTDQDFAIGSAYREQEQIYNAAIRELLDGARRHRIDGAAMPTEESVLDKPDRDYYEDETGERFTVRQWLTDQQLTSVRELLSLLATPPAAIQSAN